VAKRTTKIATDVQESVIYSYQQQYDYSIKQVKTLAQH